MTRATDVLCRLLDERGVAYVEDYEYGKKYPPERSITWSCDIAGEDMTVTARDYFIGDGEYFLDLEFHEVFTLAQAIAATLGSSNCSNDCTNSERTGTCRNVADDGFECSECKSWWTGPRDTKPPMLLGFKYCPNCGRKVVDE